MYKSKYLKYKVKYLELKKITGGMLKQENPKEKTEIQVYRIDPKVGKHYWYAESTRKYNDNIHFTTNDLEYVGEFVRKARRGSGDGSVSYAYFKRDGSESERIITYSYWGHTCFIETDPVLDIEEEKRKIKEGKIPEAMQKNLEEAMQRKLEMMKLVEEQKMATKK